VSDRVNLLDTARSPFNTFVRNLMQISEAGLWLNPFRGIPQMPGLPAIDVVYLDNDLAVMECISGLPQEGLSDADGRVASALVLPAHSIASASIRFGDQLRICNAESKIQWALDVAGVAHSEPAATEQCHCMREGIELRDSSARTDQVRLAMEKLKAQQPLENTSTPTRKKVSLEQRLQQWVTGIDESADRRRSNRLRFPKLVAYYWTGGAPKAFQIGDIGPTGFYLITEDRWVVGTRILMTLERSDSDTEAPENRMTVPSRVVRHGVNGVGFEFVASAAVDPETGKVVPSNKQSKERLSSFLQRVISQN